MILAQFWIELVVFVLFLVVELLLLHVVFLKYCFLPEFALLFWVYSYFYILFAGVVPTRANVFVYFVLFLAFVGVALIIVGFLVVAQVIVVIVAFVDFEALAAALTA